MTTRRREDHEFLQSVPAPIGPGDVQPPLLSGRYGLCGCRRNVLCEVSFRQLTNLAPIINEYYIK